MPGEEAPHIRRRTVKLLAAPFRQSNREGCSPQVCLSLLGLAVAALGTLLGMFFFSMQWRNYNVWLGGQLEWRCSLVVCSLRYARPSSLMERALDKVLQDKYASPEMEQWAIDFCNGKVEHFPTLWSLNFCENTNHVQYKLFGAFCERSDYSGKFIDGTIWSIMRYTSRTAFIMTLLSLLATLTTALFLMKDHQTCSKTKKPRWAISEEKTGKFRPYVKICAGLAPLLQALAAIQYRWCIESFERYGGIPKQTKLVGLISRESSEVAVAWAVMLFFTVSLLEGVLVAALLSGPLRRPERPIGLDIFDTCVDVQLERRTRHDVELSELPSTKASSALPKQGGVAASSSGAWNAMGPQQASPWPKSMPGPAQQHPAQPGLHLPPPWGPPKQPPMQPPMMRPPPHSQGWAPALHKASLPLMPPGLPAPRSPRQFDHSYQTPVPPNWANTSKHTSS